MKCFYRHLLLALTAVVLAIPVVANPADAVVIYDWRTNVSGSGSVGGNSYVQTVGGVTVTASAHVAELSGGNSPILGPFFTSTNPTRNGFVRNSLGLGLQIDAGSTSAPISGTELCCGLFRPGFNSDTYLTGNQTIEALNFALFEFSSPVSLNTLTVDDTSNFGRGSWIALRSSAPNFGAGLANVLTSSTVINAPDTEASDGEFSTVFTLNDTFTYMLIGAPPGQPLPGITVSTGNQFYIQSFGVTPVPDNMNPVPLPAAMWMFLSAIGGLGIVGWRRRRTLV